MGRILKKRQSTIQGGNSKLPIDLLINTHTHTNIKNIYTKIQRVKNVETFNLKSSNNMQHDLLHQKISSLNHPG